MGALLTQFMNKYAYTDFHELNADWMIKTMMELINQVENFVSLNAIKYADPIQWNITSQYEKNTVVIDPLSGTAYISVQPVPMGVSLTNTDYWTVVFDLGSFVVRAAKNFSNRYEADTTLTATFASTQGNWLVWGDTLYEVIVPTINAGDQYVIDSNIRHITMEEVCDALAQAIDAVDTKVGDLADLNTLDQTSIVNAINEILTNIGTLTDLNTSDQTSIVNAINEVNTNIDSAMLKIIFDSISALIISDIKNGRSCKVAGISGVFMISDTVNVGDHALTLTSGLFAIYKPEEFVDFLAWNTDRNSDCSTLLQDCINYANNNAMEVVVTGTYKLSNPITMPKTTSLRGVDGAAFNCEDYSGSSAIFEITHVSDLQNDKVVLSNIIFMGNPTLITSHFPNISQVSSATGLLISTNHICIKNVAVKNFNKGVTFGNYSYCDYFIDTRIYNNNYGIYFDDTGLSNAGGLIAFDRCSIAGNITGCYNVRGNLQYNHCNYDFNYVHNICDMNNSSITVGSEVYNNCQIEDETDSDACTFQELSGANDGSARIFTNCLFLIGYGRHGYFKLNKQSNLSIFQCFIRVNSPSALRNVGARLIDTAYKNVSIDQVRMKWQYAGGAVFKIVDAENICNPLMKGYTVANATMVYNNHDFTLTNTGSLYGSAERFVDVDPRAFAVCGVVTITPNVSGSRPIVVLQFKDGDNNTLDTLSQTLTLVANTPQIYTISSFNIPNGTEKIRVVIQTPDNVSGSSVKLEDLYMYQLL